MQNKGLVRFLVACLVLVCTFYLSFSIVTSRYDKKARDYGQQIALDKADELGLEGEYRAAFIDSVARVEETHYLDSFATQTVWLGHTLKECREREIGLGLDLKGGMNVTMEVSVPDILSALSEIPLDSKSTKVRDTTFLHAIKEAHKAQKDHGDDDFLGLFFTQYKASGLPLADLFKSKLHGRVEKGMADAEVEAIIRGEVNAAAENSFNVLRTRIDRFGVVQPNIQKLGHGRILIELPGVKEPKRVEKLLQGSANLEFWRTYTASEGLAKLVELNDAYAKAHEGTALEQEEAEKPLLRLLRNDVKEVGFGAVVGAAGTGDTAKINKILQWGIEHDLLGDARFCWEVKSNDDRGHVYCLVALKKTGEKGPALEGDVITNARADFESNGKAVVTMKMNGYGTREWAKLTGEEVGHSVAIVLDGFVYSAPTVNEAITGGNSQISGNFTMDDAKDLANTLNSGKMPAPARIIQSDVVGPSLGQEAIRAGLLSFILGFVLILIYMIFYYGWIPGLIADAALCLNLFFMVGVLASFNAVLTLPGIAGIVLTMGMAVDANVLIYERIREELRGGKGMRKAIEDGFKGAISAIVDANVTSFLTGAILAYFGTGPIKGFAVTYMIGIITSFLTAVFITRLLLDDYCRRENAKELSFTTRLMKNFLQNVHFNFVKARKWAYCCSGVVIIVAILGLMPNVFGKLNLGIDFSGGRNYVVRFDQKIETSKVRESVYKAFEEDAKKNNNTETFSLNVITFGNNANQVRISTNYLVKEDKVEDRIEAALLEGCKPFLSEEYLQQNDLQLAFSQPDKSVKFKNTGIMQKQMVGPSIADNIKKSAIWAIFIALIGIFVYILIRFRNFAYSVGALVALAHDTLIILGLYAILWKIMPFSMEIDQAFIAAILTVIGYSINDTVVIFDRVREYNKLYPKREKDANINDALNNTLSRTFSTSMSTFVVLLAIFIFGGENIQGFVFALLMGVIVGTYSSLFIASPIAYDIQKAIARRKEKKAAKAAK